MQHLRELFFKYRYWVLCLGVVSLMVLQVRNGNWYADFWEHAAVTRELATHLWHPAHPQLLLDGPHAFYSPYALAVAAFTKAAQLSPVTALSVMAVVNLALLLLGLAAFSSACAPKNPQAAGFYLLLFHLLLWGPGAWQYSGCFHLASLGQVLPYPSTFATSLALFAIWIFVRSQRTGDGLWYVLVWPLAVIILLTHAVGFIFLAIGLVSFSMGTGRPGIASTLQVLVLLVSALAVALFWPYYPFFELFFRQARVFHGSNQPMYQEVLSAVCFALPALPFLALRMKSNWKDPLGLMFVGLIAIYAYGGLSGKWSYGRVMPGIMLVAHMALAREASEWELRWRNSQLSPRIRRRIKALAAVAAVAVCFVLYFDVFGLGPMIGKRWFPPQKNTYSQYLFLSRFTGQYDVVLADIQTGWPVPCFGGKTVAAWHPLAFVPDHDKRREDVDAFFRIGTSNSDRWNILRSYKVKYILFTKKTPEWRQLASSMEDFGPTRYEDETFILIGVNAGDARSGKSLISSPEHGANKWE